MRRGGGRTKDRSLWDAEGAGGMSNEHGASPHERKMGLSTSMLFVRKKQRVRCRGVLTTTYQEPPTALAKCGWCYEYKKM